MGAQAAQRAAEPHARLIWLQDALERLGGLTEAVLAELDGMDTDADLEPSLGSCVAYWPTNQEAWAVGGDDDREDADADLEPDTDAEPDASECFAWQDEGDLTVARKAR